MLGVHSHLLHFSKDVTEALLVKVSLLCCTLFRPVPKVYLYNWFIEDQKELLTACSVGWFVSLLIREEILLADLCERKILFRLKIYDRLRQATAKRTGC